MKRLALVLATFLPTGCATTHPNAGHWVGSVAPATAGATCEKSRAILDIAKDGKVMFAPNQGTWTLAGTISGDGTIVATRTQPGADKKPFVTRLDAKLTPGAIAGAYATPRCSFTVILAPGGR